MTGDNQTDPNNAEYTVAGRDVTASRQYKSDADGWKTNTFSVYAFYAELLRRMNTET